MKSQNSNNRNIMLAFIFWMLCSMVLVFSVIGLLLFIPPECDFDGDERSTWSKIGLGLFEKLKE